MSFEIESERRPDWTEAAVVAAGGTVVGFTLFLPAVELRYGTESVAYSMRDFGWFGHALLAGVVGITVATIVELRLRSEAPSRAAWGYAILGSVLILTIVAAEGLETLIPDKALPDTIRRFSMAMGTRAAPWVALVACAIALVAGRRSTVVASSRLGRLQGESLTGQSVRIVSGVLSAAGVWLVAAGRNEPIVRGEAAGASVEVTAWALPVAGPASLMLLFIMAAGAALVLFDVRPVEAAITAAAASWFIAGGCALVIATSGLVVRESVVEWVAEYVGRTGVDLAGVESGAGGIMGFWGALLVAVSVSSTLALGGRRS